MSYDNTILTKMLDQDYLHISNDIKSFISDTISKSQTYGLVIGLSGGLDSSVVLKCGVDALGPDKVFGLVLPSNVTPKEDVNHAVRLAQNLKIEYKLIDIGPLIESYTRNLPNSDKKNMGNLVARIRMNILYYHGGLRNHLVAGTSDKSELYIGFYTKYGDGGSDLMPIANLYKTQVRSLAKFLGISHEIIEKKSSPRLWANHLAEEEIGIEYELIDLILHLLIDNKMTPENAALKLRTSLDNVLLIKKMVDKSAHKRKMPDIAKVAIR